MGAAFSSNSATVTVDEINNSINNNQSLNSNISTSGCEQTSVINFSAGVGCPAYNPPIKYELSGTVNIESDGMQVCKFNNASSNNYLSTQYNNFQNSSDVAVSQVNKILQEAGSFSLAGSTNSTQIGQNLLNQMLTNAISQNVMQCSSVANQNSATNFTLCADLTNTGIVNIKNNPTQQFMSSCISNGMYKAYGSNTASNQAIATATQYNSITQQGLWTIILALAVLFLVLIGGPTIPLLAPGVQKSGAIWVFVFIIVVIIVGICIAIGLGIYFWLYPPVENIDPINIDAKNDIICFTIGGTSYTANIPNAVYSEGNLLASAIEGAMTKAMYPTGSAISKFADNVGASIAGSASCSLAQSVQVQFEENDKTFTFFTYGAGDNSCGDNISFNTNCPNSIFPTIDPSGAIVNGTQYSSGTGTNVATTSKVKTNAPTSVWPKVRAALIGLGIFALLMIGVFLLYKWMQSRQKNGGKTQPEAIEMKEIKKK